MTGSPSLEDTIAPVLARWLKPLTADDAATAVAGALRAAGVVPAQPATHDTTADDKWVDYVSSVIAPAGASAYEMIVYRNMARNAMRWLRAQGWTEPVAAVAGETPAT